jgi:hypothetical protein
MCVTQEFGTLAPHVVGSNLVEENFAWHHHLPSSVAAGLAVRDSFYVDTVAWKRSVVARGNQVIADALRYLME